jgi:DNA-binding transcriptional MerR regulator
MALQMALALSQQDMQKLGELLNQIAQQWNRLSPEERKKLEELMRQLAQALQGTQLDAAARELQEALKNLKVGDLQQAVKWIQKAGGT